MRVDAALRPGLVFMTLHFPDQVETNLLTIDATDPEVGHRRVQGQRRSGSTSSAATGARGRSAGPASAWRRSVVDLHLIAAGGRRDDERAAVDERARRAGRARWRRRVERDAVEGHVARGAGTRPASDGTCCCRRSTRCTAGRLDQRGRAELRLPAAHVPPAEAYGVATFYAMFSTETAAATVVHVCDDIACRIAGAERRSTRSLADDRTPRASASGVDLDAALPRPVRARARGVPPDGGSGAATCRSAASTVGRSSRSCTAAPERRPRSRRHATAPQTARRHDATRVAAAAPRASGVVDPDVARRLPGARRLRGAAARARARARGRDPRGHGLEAARARRRGVPDRREVEGRREQPVRPALLRLQRRRVRARARSRTASLMEEDPFAVVEAMTIAGLRDRRRSRASSTSAASTRCATERLEHAIEQARRRGFLGDDVMGEGFAFDIELRRGAGAYICGEETALFNSIEGKRGEPRNKPPFPVEQRPVRQADRHQQRRDAGQRARGPPRSAARRSPRIGTAGSTGHAAVLPVRVRRDGRASTRSSTARRSAS